MVEMWGWGLMLGSQKQPETTSDKYYIFILFHIDFHCPNQHHHSMERSGKDTGIS